jgi:DNA-binding NarL/FixJ family response regulator
MQPSAGKTRVLVVHDHPVVREGLIGLINRQSDLICCGEAGTILEAQTALETKAVDLLLLDLQMGVTDGLENIKSFRARFPDLSILVISQSDETIYAERALRAGARGYVMKEQATEELLRAIRRVITGQLCYSQAVARLAVQRMRDAHAALRDSDLSALSDRELHVFE